MKSYKNTHYIVLFLITVFLSSVKSFAKVPPYGYYLGKDTHCSIWWTEGLYKIKWETPVPKGKIKPIRLKSAKNEYESFQLVINPDQKITNMTVHMEGFKDKSGNSINKSSITIRDVVYLYVDQPTDYYGKIGWYPDPLPELKKPLIMEAGKNHPLWITVKIPENAKPGTYKGKILLKADGWSKTIPVELEVWNFSLPDKPTIRSSFGLRTNLLQKYHHLENEEQLKIVADKYYKAMYDYKIAPTKPFELYPMKVTIEGLHWNGGIFSSDSVYSGKKSLKIIDDDVSANIEASTNTLIKVNPSEKYKLFLRVRTLKKDQRYSVLVKCFDKNKKNMIYENRMKMKKGKRTWQQDTLVMRPFKKDIRYISVHLFPAFRSMAGCDTGTAWFDEISLVANGKKTNLIKQGDFEVTPDDLTVKVDFTEFDKGGKKYIEELGFNAYHLPLEGMPSGNFFKQKKGLFHGFYQGTPEYDKMMQKYIMIVQKHLEEKGWLGKEYVYWFDEPQKENYPFVREGMEIIHKSAPKITTFITEDNPGSSIMDVTDISCTNISKINPNVVNQWKGREFWSYLCCCPTAPNLTLFLDHDAVNMRMWLWLSYKFKLKGILVWTVNYWNSENALPKGFLQDPWKNPMSYSSGNYGNPWGRQEIWGNGDGRLFYPPVMNPNKNTKTILDDPIPSYRLETMRDGIEDYEYLVILEKLVLQDKGKHKKLIKEAKDLLNIPSALVEDQTHYNKDPKSLIEYRNKVGNLINALQN
jgi:hypothetical protein